MSGRLTQGISLWEGNTPPSSPRLLWLDTSGADAIRKRNLASVAAMWLFCPATDYDWLHANGYGAEMDAAYGGNWNANKIGHVPITDAAVMRGAGIPIHITQGDQDPTVLPEHTAAYVAAVNDPLVTESIAAGAVHIDVPNYVSPDDVAAFFLAHLS